MKRFVRLFAALPLGLLLVCGAVPAWAASVVSDSPGPVFISYPSAIGDGQAFTFSVSVPLEVEKMQVLWRGKQIALPLEKHASGRFRVGYCLLAVPLDETGEFPVSVRFPKKTAPPLRVADVVAEFERVLQDGNHVQVEDLPLSPVRIVPRPYPVQKLTVPPKYVAPPASEQARIERDRKEMNAALGHFTPELYWKPANGAFMLASPGTTQITSYFGSRRVFNNQPRSPHKGLDLDGVEGDAILACAPGKVVLAADHYYSGQVVVLDHGLGIKTIYMHLSAINVRPGQMLKAGEQLGLMGKTGRVTGPHLHLGFNVLGTSVDAADFLQGLVPPQPSEPEAAQPGISQSGILQPGQAQQGVSGAGNAR